MRNLIKFNNKKLKNMGNILMGRNSQTLNILLGDGCTSGSTVMSSHYIEYDVKIIRIKAGEN